MNVSDSNNIGRVPRNTGVDRKSPAMDGDPFNVYVLILLYDRTVAPSADRDRARRIPSVKTCAARVGGPFPSATGRPTSPARADLSVG